MTQLTQRREPLTPREERCVPVPAPLGTTSDLHCPQATGAPGLRVLLREQLPNTHRSPSESWAGTSWPRATEVGLLDPNPDPPGMHCAPLPHRSILTPN